MRTRMLAAACVFIVACAGEPQPKLTISPSGSQTISAPVLITSSPPQLASEVAWSLSGPGGLSGTSGGQVTYRPPVPPTSTPATVTATARGQTATVTFTGQPLQQAKGVIPSLTADVSVTYDQFDIPHIFCAVPADCFAVQGYIQAQDRLFQMDLFRRTAEGTLSQLVGPVEIDQDAVFRRVFITRDLERIEDKLVTALSPEIATDVNAYTAGVNAYLGFLAAHPTLMPQEYAQLPGAVTPGDIPPWRPQDTLAIGRLQQFQLSETIEKETGYGLFALTFVPGSGIQPDAGRFAAYVLPAQPVNGFTLSATDFSKPSSPPAGALVGPRPADFTGTAATLGAIHSQMRELNGLFGSIREGAGSNNWVVDGAHSATTFAMVANDPHLALQYPPLFHLSAMTSADGKLNVTGGSFPGVPGALVGRGAHVGWGVTVVGYDVTDLYQEQVTACGSPSGLCVNFKTGSVAISVKQYDDIQIKGQPLKVYVVPHHGPILSPAVPVPGSAISMRWTGHEVTADLEGFLGLIEATAVGTDTDAVGSGTAFGALKNYAIGAQNFVLADDTGHIGYDPHALVPRRDWSFTPGTAGTAGHVPWFPLDGISGTAEWGSGVAGDNCGGAGATAPTIPGPCWVPDNQLPRGVNPAKGYFATANSDPAGFTGNPNSPFFSSVDPTLYSYLSFDWDDPTDIRYARIAEFLKDKTTVSPTSSGKVTLKDMQDLQSDHKLLLAQVFEDRGFYPASTDQTYTAARALLTAWNTPTNLPYDCPTGLTSSDPRSAPVTDASTLTKSAACLLFHTFLNNLLHNVFDDDFAFVSAATGQSFSGDTGAEIRALVVKLLPNPTATGTFCDDVGNTLPFTVTTAKTCATQVVDALVAAYTSLSAANGTNTNNWLWGRVHTLSTVSPAAPLIANGFTTGPFARPGGALTVDVGNPSGSQSSPLGFAYGSGSNVRHISVMDPNPANAQVRMQLPGPERDAPFGVFSSTPDLLGQYVQNQYFDFLHGHQIDNKGVSAQGFSKQ
jgi:penicillin amidase